MVTTAKKKLNDLIVNTENYRYDPVSEEQDAINKMLAEQEKKILNMAQHILNYGLNPNKKIQIFPSRHENGKYIVQDGNRRIVALKILMNPLLVENLATRKKVQAILEKNKNALIEEIECNIFERPEDNYEWVKLEHAGENEGVGTVDWNAQQVDRFEEKVEGESSIALQTIGFLSKSDAIPQEIKESLPKLRTTNLDRLLSDPDVRTFLGIKINSGILQSEIDEIETAKGLSRLTKDLLNHDFSVKDIYTKEDRKEYIDNFPKEDRPDLTHKFSKPWQLANVKPKKTTKKPTIVQKERKYLIPKTCSLNISNPKVNAIYGELQRIDLQHFTNAVAVSFRVFVELSIDCYIDENMKNSGVGKKKYREKVADVAQHLIDQKSADKNICKGISTSIQNKHDILGVDTWHAYVHNPYFSPTPQNLLITWDNVQKFIEILWSNIK